MARVNRPTVWVHTHPIAGALTAAGPRPACAGRLAVHPSMQVRRIWPKPDVARRWAGHDSVQKPRLLPAELTACHRLLSRAGVSLPPIRRSPGFAAPVPCACAQCHHLDGVTVRQAAWPCCPADCRGACPGRNLRDCLSVSAANFRALLHRRVRNAEIRCRVSTSYSSMGFVPLRGPSRAASVRDWCEHLPRSDIPLPVRCL
jgi:hypothetical protein